MLKLYLSFNVWLKFCPLDLDPWNRIFLRIRFQEAKILRILRILSTVNLYKPSFFRWMIMIYRLIYHHQQSQVLINLLTTFVHAAEQMSKFIYKVVFLEF